jgi:hypothetical protein
MDKIAEISDMIVAEIIDIYVSLTACFSTLLGPSVRLTKITAKPRSKVNRNENTVDNIVAKSLSITIPGK